MNDTNDTNDTNHLSDVEPTTGPDPLRRHTTEAAIGLVIALLLLWTAIASATDVPFVYQGL